MAEKKPPIWQEPAHYPEWVKWSDPRFKKAMETKYAKEWGSNKVGTIARADKLAGNNKTKYLRLGYQQNPRKVEMAKCGAATTKKRGPASDSRLLIVDNGRLKEKSVENNKISASINSNLFFKSHGGERIK